MDENEVMTTEELTDIPDPPDFDPEEWERKRKEEWEAMLAPYKAAAEQRKESDKNDVMDKLDAFLAADRITTAQYQELVAMMD